MIDSKDIPIRILVLGAGRVGARVARQLVDRGIGVVATTTNQEFQTSLEALGVQVISWRWGAETSWDALRGLGCEAWCVTVPPRGGQELAEAFHRQLVRVAHEEGVKKLLWTSSTSVYAGCGKLDIHESDAGHVRSKHSGVDLLAMEFIHASTPGFTAMRFGGLFGEGMHPVLSMARRNPIAEADASVQWVHLDDAAAACVHVLLHRVQASALNVVAPEVRTRRELLVASWPADCVPVMGSGGKLRIVKSDALTSHGFKFRHPDPKQWCEDQLGVWRSTSWQGPHGTLHVDVHPAQVLGHQPKVRLLMVHGYKGFKSWGNWSGLADAWSRLGWEVHRMDFSHNGHVSPFSDDCLDEVAWSQNHHHYEAEEVHFALDQMANMSPEVPVAVLGHSRGGGMAILGADRFLSSGGALAGCAVWASVSDFIGRLPTGSDLEAWQASNRWEVVNGRTGQVLWHPYEFAQETLKRKDELNIVEACRRLTVPFLAVHGEADPVVAWQEGRKLTRVAQDGTWALIDGANHVMGMAHPWKPGTPWPKELTEASDVTANWLENLAQKTSRPQGPACQ